MYLQISQCLRATTVDLTVQNVQHLRRIELKKSMVAPNVIVNQSMIFPIYNEFRSANFEINLILAMRFEMFWETPRSNRSFGEAVCF